MVGIENFLRLRDLDLAAEGARDLVGCGAEDDGRDRQEDLAGQLVAREADGRPAAGEEEGVAGAEEDGDEDLVLEKAGGGQPELMLAS